MGRRSVNHFRRGDNLTLDDIKAVLSLVTLEVTGGFLLFIFQHSSAFSPPPSNYCPSFSSSCFVDQKQSTLGPLLLVSLHFKEQSISFMLLTHLLTEKNHWGESLYDRLIPGATC